MRYERQLEKQELRAKRGQTQNQHRVTPDGQQAGHDVAQGTTQVGTRPAHAIEGDEQVLAYEQQARRGHRHRHNRRRKTADSEVRSGRNTRAATARPERLWDYGVIPYEIESNFSGKSTPK